MITYGRTIEIASPVEEVFGFVADRTNAPRWQTDLHEVRRLTEGPIGVGTEHEFVRVLAGRRVASRNRLVGYDPGRYVAFEIPAGWITGQASYLVEASPSGRTALTSRMDFHLRGIARLLEPILGRLLAGTHGATRRGSRSYWSGVALPQPRENRRRAADDDDDDPCGDPRGRVAPLDGVHVVEACVFGEGAVEPVRFPAGLEQPGH